MPRRPSATPAVSTVCSCFWPGQGTTSHVRAASLICLHNSRRYDNNAQSREMVPVPTSMVLLLSVKAGLRAKDQLGT